jgi:hypothetical protein
MSYFTNFQNPQDIKELLLKTEYALLSQRNDEERSRKHVNDLLLEQYIIKEGNLVLRAHQLFVGNWIDPNTSFLRMLVNHSTGSGKTLLALSMANKFIGYFQDRFDISGQKYAPTIYIVGFVRHNFQKELMTRPEFGFVNKKEVADYGKLKYLAETGSKKDQDALVDFESKIKKRFSKRTRGGFYKFIGYKELFNRLFDSTGHSKRKDDGDSEGVDADSGASHLTEDQIMEGLKSGKVTLNLDFLDTFANSLMICDEIHNTYNSVDINNYGAAIQLILNIYDMPEKMGKLVNLSGKTAHGVNRMSVLRNSVIRAIYMSATPINNSPTEIVDLLNLLIPGAKLTKDEFFVDNRTLKAGALNRIADISRGYVSFLRDENPKMYPEKIYEGDSIKLPPKYRKMANGASKIPYLKFTRCPMSSLHNKTYEKFYDGSLPPDGQTLIDMVFPSPKETELGLFRSKEIKYELTNAPRKWKDKNKIDITRQSISGSSTALVITGEFWNVENIEKYSAKYTTLVKDAIKNLRNDGGKIIISHQYVKISGVLGLQELFRKNGFIDEFSSPSSSTLCSKCGKPMKGHPSAGPHDFIPARFITLHGELDKSSENRSIDKFNAPDNTDGYNYRIILGSKVLNEALDFNAVRNIWISFVPPNISALLQIIGRGYRTGSALLLPPEKRTLTIKIYTSSLPKGKWEKELSYEERKYFEKVQDYLVIQDLNKVLNSNAVDAPINYQRVFHSLSNKDELGPLHYDVPGVFTPYWQEVSKGKREIRINDLRTQSFNAWHNDDELNVILYIIKRAFIEQSSVWTYEDLLKFVRNPPFRINVNTSLFDEDNFKIALYVMTDMSTVDAYSILTQSVAHNPIDRLFNPLDRKIVFPNGDEAMVQYMNGYYILFPVKRPHDESGSSVLGLESMELLGYPDVDIDSWYRHSDDFEKTTLNITKYLKASHLSYSQMKYKFYKSFKNVPIEAMPISSEIYDVAFHKQLLEDCVQYAFNILTHESHTVSEMHDFYFKMLYFYDRMEMILFAVHLEDGNVTNDHLRNMYKQYTVTPDPKIGPYVDSSSSYKYNAFLQTSINKSSLREDLDFSRLDKFISGPASRARAGKRDIIRKVPSNMLPVGHFLNTESTSVTVPWLYNPVDESWAKAPEFVRTLDLSISENNVMIGYYEKSQTGIDVKFKTRAPIQKIVKHADTRMIERGATCDAKRKEEIIEMLGQVGIKNISDEPNIKELCEMLKIELMRRELVERQKARHEKTYKRVRWFYMHFEQQPDI